MLDRAVSASAILDAALMAPVSLVDDDGDRQRHRVTTHRARATLAAKSRDGPPDELH